MLREMWNEDWVGKLVVIGIVLTFALVLFAIYMAMQEEKDWKIFADAHHCKIVGRMAGAVETGVGYGIASNGQFGTIITTNSAPDRTGWLCDDGVTYWR